MIKLYIAFAFLCIGQEFLLYCARIYLKKNNKPTSIKTSLSIKNTQLLHKSTEAMQYCWLMYFLCAPAAPGFALCLTFIQICINQNCLVICSVILINYSNVNDYCKAQLFLCPLKRNGDRDKNFQDSQYNFFFADMGNFMDTNQRKTVTQGQAAVLNFLHIVSYPRPQVTWFRDGHKIIPSSRM